MSDYPKLKAQALKSARVLVGNIERSRLVRSMRLIKLCDSLRSDSHIHGVVHMPRSPFRLCPMREVVELAAGA